MLQSTQYLFHLMQRQRPSISVDQHSSIFEGSNSFINWQSLYQKQHQHRLRLQQQNKVLKIKYQRILNKKHNTSSLRPHQCQKCLQQSTINKNSFNKKDIKKIKGQFQFFSKEIESRLNKIEEKVSEDMIESSVEEIDDKEQFQKSEIPFIENFAVLGIDDDSICSYKKNVSEEPEGGVIYSVRKITPVEEHAVHFAVPSGMSIKSIPNKKISEKVTKIMINHCKQNTFLLTFKEEPHRLENLNPEVKELLELINPNHRLFCHCIGTYDFTYVKKENPNENDISLTNNSFEMSGSLNNSSKLNNSDILPSIPSIIPNELNSEEEIRVSQRVYCIFSYFPLFSFFSNILLSLLNLVKLERLEIFKDKIQDIKKIDSRFQLKRIEKLYNKYLKKFNRQYVRLNIAYHLNLMNQNLLLEINKKSILYSESEEWDYQIMSLFTIDTFIDVLTLFLLEDKLFFICDQSRILTFTVYLISTYLCRPFNWVFEYVCIIPKEEEFLNTPFPSAYGVLKKKEWVKEKQILENFKNTYVFINPSGIEIKYTQKRNDILDKKSKKLREELLPFFDKMKRRKKEKQQQLNENQKLTEYNWYSEAEDRNIVTGLFQTLKRFMTNQVMRYIPSLETLRKIKDRVHTEIINEKKDPHSYLIEQIVSYIISQREYKDPFVNQLLKTQMLSQHISELVDQLE